MDLIGYRLNGNSKTAAPDYIPSLIGVDPNQIAGQRGDPYFESFEVTNRTITGLARSRWVAFDSLPSGERDPILEVRSPGGAYYALASELYETAAFHHDDETIELIVALGVAPK